MIRNYLKTAIRNLGKHKIYSAINITGLAVGLTCCILIYLYLVDEISYDNFHAQEQSIYRVMTSFAEDGSVRDRGPAVPLAVAPVMKDVFPEIQYCIRIAESTKTVTQGEKMANERITFTDPPFFSVFSFPLKMGNPDSVLSNDYSIVLSQSMAEKYFGDKNPMGERISITFGENKKDFVVTAIVEDAPRNSTIQFKVLIHIDNIPLGRYKEALTNLGDFSFPLYVQLKPGIRPEQIEYNLDAFISQTFAAEFKQWRERGFVKNQANPISMELQQLRDMHFDTNSWDGTDPANAIILASIALIVLVIACINFINLSIGRAAVRSVEIGMRKVIGANKKQLMYQFWIESLVLVLLALLLGILLSGLFMPTFNQLAGKELLISDFANVSTILALCLLLFVVAIASGSYPGLVMSGIQPVQIFRNKLGMGGRRTLAKILVVVQFALSVFLMISTLVLGRQICFMTEKDPGYVKEGLVSIRIQEIYAEDSQKVVDLFRNKLRSFPNVLNISAVNNSFGRGTSRFPVEKDGKRINIHQFRIDYDYIQTVGLKLIQGRNFSSKRSTDVDAAIVNQEFCRQLDIADPIGHRIGEFVDGPDDTYPYLLEIIGVIKDYNVLSFKHNIQPILLMMEPGWGMSNMLVRINNIQISSTLELLEKTWKEIRPDKPFVYSFVEDDLESQYNTEKKWSGIVRFSSLFAVLIACMGIFGLTSLAVNRRFKEIGIRKVLGANVPQIFSLVAKEFILLVMVANLVAWPLAYYVMRLVLSNYFYRIPLAATFFLITGTISVAIALLTISYLAVKAALSDPVRAIRYE